ncbi:MAG: LLM class flavin-dependent oxidoreductase [Desulfurellaceae bacterium]|nr:LLM class flavin-dependent oxidoreductase [Desulfurellaceae bacterium]
MAQIGLALAGGMSPTDVVDCVKYAEEQGYTSAWFAEGHGGDQFSVLTACALATQRIQLGTSISSIFVRSVPTIAMAAACVDHYSQQRFILGLGSSHKVQVEPEHGIPYGQPVQRMRETVEIIRTLLREGAVSYQGEVVTIEQFDLWFQPARPELPIYISAVFPQMLQACGELAQGTILVWSAPEAGKLAAENIAIGARRAGRQAEEVDIVSLLPMSVAQDHQEALARLRPLVAFYAGFFPRYNRVMAEQGFPEEAQAIRAAWQQGDRQKAVQLVPDPLIETVSVVGTPTECRARVEAYRDSGIVHPVIFPVSDGPSGKQHVLDAVRACAP